MNRSLSLFARQQGYSFDYNYDFVLGRLRVANEDSWKGITPSNYSADFNPHPPIFSAKFAKHENYKHILAIANEDGKIALQDTTKTNGEAEEKALDGTQCHFNAVFDLEWAPGQMKFVSASGDHTTKLWDVCESEIKESRVFSGHTRSVKTAAFRKTDPSVFASGGRDGAILIWDTRAKLNMDLPRADNCILSGHGGGPGTPVSQKKRTRTPKLGPNLTSSSITGLGFQDDNTLISCGAGDGIIKVWDLRRNYSCYKKEPLPKHSLPYAGTTTLKGYTNLLIDKAGVKMYVNCMDNTIYCYNLSSYSTKPMQRYVGFKNGTFYIKSCLSPDENYLVSGSSNEKAYIWNLNNPNPVATLHGHTVEVTCAAWGDTRDLTIVTCSDDARHKVWRVGPEKVEEDEAKNSFKGAAEFLSKGGAVCTARGSRLKALEYTPKSLKRLVQQNETTPSTIEKISTKRSFLEMSGSEINEVGSEQKRAKPLETRGRRLFSPSTSSCPPSFNSVDERRFGNLSLIREEPESPQVRTKSDQENSLAVAGPSSMVSPVSSINKTPTPLSERPIANVMFTSPPSSAPHSTIFSPTSNLPNYVLNGDAPHLGISSPKRKAKDKVDWLTKLRKQKLMSSRTTLSDKINPPTPCDTTEDACLLSPRLQSLRGTECSPRPRRRSSSHSDNPAVPRTPTSSRRNEPTLLKFFAISNNRQQPSQEHPMPSTSTAPFPTQPKLNS